MHSPNPANSTSKIKAFRKSLSSSFNEQEIRALCFDLGVDYEDLPGQIKTEKIIELIKLLSRLGRWNDLIDHCHQLRPNQDWSIYREIELENNQIHLIDQPFAYSKTRPLYRWLLVFFGVLAALLIISIVMQYSRRGIGSTAIEPTRMPTQNVTATSITLFDVVTATETIDPDPTAAPLPLADENECRTLLDDLQNAFSASDSVEIAYTKVNLREQAVYSIMNANNAYLQKSSANSYEARFDTAFEDQVNDSRRDDTTFRIEDNGDAFTVQIVLHSWGETVIQRHEIQCFNSGRNKLMQGLEVVAGSPIGAWQVIFFISPASQSVSKFDEPDQAACQFVFDALWTALEQEKTVEMTYTKANFREESERDGSVYAAMSAENIFVNASGDSLSGRFLTAFENQTTEDRRDDTTFQLGFDGKMTTQVILHTWGDTLLHTQVVRCVNAGQNKIIQGIEVVDGAMNGVWQTAFNVR